ncbi:MAG: nicotinate (nicotinamide) nucleotide adenylyltransferase [Leptolyngbyaceae cyanobacterium SL_7_1]|nr:nicotinate (nicotinamide) nucleotide adenylyltransferase [Leptolyngbyaceae cyanobacterium SL_7_1]
MQRLAIFGGTFNPVHWGHLLVAETAIAQAGLDRVFWVPTAHPSYRSPQDVLDLSQRLEMVTRAIADHPQFAIATLPSTSAPSYAIDTLRYFKAKNGGNEWYWIIGLDAFRSVPHWYRRHEWVEECQWLVAPRAVPPELKGTFENVQDYCQTYGQNVAERLAEQSIVIRWQGLSMPLLEISSSLIRAYCGDRRSIRYLVPEAVRTYIIEKKLYISADPLPTPTADGV